MVGIEETILDALRSGKFLLSVHAASRMSQRAITRADIQLCGHTAKCCIYQWRQGTWRVEGEDLGGEPITVICGIDRDVVIITAF